MKLKLPKSHHPWGYTRKEILAILRKHKIHHATFWMKFGVNTCGYIGNESIFFTCDVERTLAKILGYRKVCVEEED